MQGKVLELHSGVQRIAGLLLRRSQNVVVERGAVQQDVNPNSGNQNEQSQDRDNPRGYAPPSSTLARGNQIRFARLVRGKS